MFNRIGAGLRNRGKTQDSMAASLSGEAMQRRLIAYNYGIDPYTDLPPLKEKLDALSRAAAAGGWTELLAGSADRDERDGVRRE